MEKRGEEGVKSTNTSWDVTNDGENGPIENASTFLTFFGKKFCI